MPVCWFLFIICGIQTDESNYGSIKLIYEWQNIHTQKKSYLVYFDCEKYRYWLIKRMCKI